MSPLEAIKGKLEQLRPVMDERVCRLWAAAEAQALGWGGVTLVAQATGFSRKRIGVGLRELRAAAAGSPAPQPATGRVRRPGGGRKPKTETDTTLLDDLEALVEPLTRGDPMSPLRWTCKSLHPSACASAAAHSRQTRSSITGRNCSNFHLIASRGLMPSLNHTSLLLIHLFPEES